MNAPFSLAAIALSLICASPSAASVISAASQTARSKPADKVDYLDVTTIQNDLNASLRRAADLSAPASFGPRMAPSTTSGGYLLGSTPTTSPAYGLGGDLMENLFNPDSEKRPDAISLDSAGPIDVLGAGGLGRGRGNGQGHGGGQGGGHGGGQGGGHGSGQGGTGGEPGDGVQAAPEPSTWLLLGTGLAMVGVYVTLRRRAAVEAR